MTDKYYMKIARSVAKVSTSKLNKVGAVLTNGSDQSIGFNHSMREDGSCEYEKDGKLIPYAEVIHAEESAIFHAWFETQGTTLYVSVSPCMHCAALIIEAEIGRVVYRREHWNKEALELLRNNGVEVVKYIKE